MRPHRAKMSDLLLDLSRAEVQFCVKTNKTENYGIA